MPAAGDDAVINTPGITVTHNNNIADSVSSITSAAEITLSRGTLAVTGNFQMSSATTFTLQGGTLAGTTISGDGATVALTNSGGTLGGGIVIAAGVHDRRDAEVLRQHSKRHREFQPN